MIDRPSTDPVVAAFADLVDDFTEIMDSAERTVRKGYAYRENLLWIHAIAALLMGPLFAMTPQSSVERLPAFFVLRLLPGNVMTLGLILTAGGLLVGAGMLINHYRAKIIGLWLLFAFYAFATLVFLIPLLLAIVGGAPRALSFHSPILYGHLAAIMLAHILSHLRAAFGK